MGNGWTLFAPQCDPTQHSAPPVNGSRPPPTGYYQVTRSGTGRGGEGALGWGHLPPQTTKGKERRERERERERDPRHEPAIQFMVCSAQDVPRKEGGVLAILLLGLFRPVCRPHVGLLPLKGGKCRSFLFWGLFGPFVDRMCTFFLPSKEGGVLAFFGG